MELSSKYKIVYIDNKEIYETKDLPINGEIFHFTYEVSKIISQQYKNKNELYDIITTKINSLTEEEKLKHKFQKIPSRRYDKKSKELDFLNNYFGGLKDDFYGWGSEQIFIKNNSNIEYYIKTRMYENEDEECKYFFKNYKLKPGKIISLKVGNIGLVDLIYSEFSNKKSNKEIYDIVESLDLKKNQQKIVSLIKKNPLNAFKIISKMVFNEKEINKKIYYGVSF